MQGDGGKPIGIDNITLKITTDGIKTIIVRLQDRAGNISEPITIKLKKDSTPPEIPALEISDSTINSSGFKIVTATTDNMDQITGGVRYDFYIKKVNELEKEELIASNKDGKHVVTGLDPNTEYLVYVNARDEAGNISKSENRIAKTNEKAPEPVITLNGTKRR